MKTKTFKEELEGYSDILGEINSLKYKIKKREKEVIEIGGINFEINGDIKAKGYRSNTAENYIVNKDKEIRKIQLKIEELEAKLKLIDTIINTLNPYNKRLIELRYKYNLSLKAIADDTERSEASICRTINNCIEKMTKKWVKWTSVK